MTSVSKNNFDQHITECRDAIAIYQHLEKDGYRAEFGLRFVWIAAVSALDHYVTELIVEVTTERFANKKTQTPKLLNERAALAHALDLSTSNPIDAVLIFRNAVSQAVRFKSFQNAEGLADGLSYVWAETHKWIKLSEQIGLPAKDVREKLNNISARRNLIAHNADFEEISGHRIKAELSDAEEVVQFIEQLVETIESLAT